jgi:DNA polymerase elongation subunit (family B)
MDSIDLELKIKTLTDGIDDPEKIEEISRLQKKIWMNSFYKPCASPVFFYNYDSSMAQKVTEAGRQALREFIKKWAEDGKMPEVFEKEVKFEDL